MRYTENQSTDAIGEKSLDIIGEADKFNKWIYNTIHPFYIQVMRAFIYSCREKNYLASGYFRSFNLIPDIGQIL